MVFHLCSFWNNAIICICECRCFAGRFNFCHSFKSCAARNCFRIIFGKQIGVFVLSYLSVKLKIADKPNNSTWPAFYAVSILTGIGFTMSLFVGNLAFANDMQYMDGVKIGVLMVHCFQLFLAMSYYYYSQKNDLKRNN